MDLSGRRVLITGAGGFIGSHVTEALLQANATVRALVRYNSRQSRGWLSGAVLCHPGLEIMAGDIRDPFLAARAVAGCDTVLNLAALIAIPYSYTAPASYVETNIVGTLNLLEAAKAACVELFVQTSTSEVYGTAVHVPMTEEHRLHPQSPYAATKVASDQLALSYHRSFGLPVLVVRPFNAYGPRQSPRAVLPSIILQLLDKVEELRLGSLHPTRDFTFAPDLAQAFAIAVAKRTGIGEVVNIGSGFEISIAEAVRALCEITGRSPPVTTDPDRLRPRKSEVDRLFADAGKAGALWGWTPEHGGPEGFRRGLEKTLAWYADSANRMLYEGARHAL